jgi:two-component system, OmpR family, response regulator
VKILFIEDDEKIAAFVQRGLKEAGYVVDHCADGGQGYSFGLTYQYDAAIIDLMLPTMDGLQIIDELRQRGIRLPVIILSAKRSVEDRLRGFQSGSDDYLTKPFALSELLARLAALIRRASNVVEPTTLSFHDLKLDLMSRAVTRGGERLTLQPREFSLLEYLMRNPNRVISKTMIMEHVWNYNFDPQTNMVEARICKLREKINKDFAMPLIHTVRGVGYVLRKEQ